MFRSKLFTLVLIATVAMPTVLPAPVLAQTSARKKSTRKKATRKRVPPRVERVTKAFVASADLKPMAVQLMQHPSAAAYAGVEKYARKHAGEDAGALAWLVLGYSHYSNHEYAQAVPALKNAQAKAGELSDYVDYFLASSYQQSGQPAMAVSAIGNFDETFRQSVLQHDAEVLYGNSLMAGGHADQAISFLGARQVPARADLLLALARAYGAAGQRTKAIGLLHQVYSDFPLSAEADMADDQLKAMARTGPVPPLSYEDRKQRIDGLMARHPDEAAGELKELLKVATAADRIPLQMSLAAAYYRLHRYDDMEKIFDKVPDLTPDLTAQKLYYRLEDDRPDEGKVLQDLSRIRQLAPGGSWMESALLSTANMYLLKRDLPNAVQYYTELAQRFPKGKYGSSGHWKSAWLTYREKKYDDALRLFNEQISQYPDTAEAPAAWYWRARLKEDRKDFDGAASDYRYIVSHYRLMYYALRARARLIALGHGSDVPADVTIGPKRAYVVADIPADDLRAQKALLLENAALFDYAIRELQVADATQPWALAEMVRMYQDAGRYDRGLQLLKRTFTGYYSWDLARLPRFFWEGLFPRPYWTDLSRYSTENGLDPLLVASLVRQESEFNPSAVSSAAAVGLMQLLPGTGRKTAKDLKLRHFNASQLYDPAVNLQLGTYYFRRMLDKYDGHVEYALAAYNAGADRVDDWRSAGEYRDMDEFVESIPFTETREYVQAIIRNAAVYKLLYSSPAQQARK